MNVFIAGRSVAEHITRPWGSAFRRYVADRPDTTGAGSVSGVVRVSGVFAARSVEVYDQATMALVAVTTSDGATGAWSVSGLSTSRPLRVVYRGTGGERDVTIQGVYAV
jgi:hypothetical protein